MRFSRGLVPILGSLALAIPAYTVRADDASVDTIVNNAMTALDHNVLGIARSFGNGYDSLRSGVSGIVLGPSDTSASLIGEGSAAAGYWSATGADIPLASANLASKALKGSGDIPSSRGLVESVGSAARDVASGVYHFATDWLR